MSLDLTWDLSFESSTITPITLPILIGVAHAGRAAELRTRLLEPR